MDKLAIGDPHATLAAWRTGGADRVDPVRFRFIEAMAQRAQAQQGTARGLLDARIETLLAAYGEQVEQRHAAPLDARPDAPHVARPPGPLAALTETLARHAADQTDHSLPSGVPASLVGPAELKSTAYFRSTWSRLSAQRRMTESLAQLPDNAGPLNSHRLVHRAMSLMHALSPDYLQRFMAHVDALMWVDQLQQEAATSGKDGARSKGGRKPRGRPA